MHPFPPLPPPDTDITAISVVSLLVWFFFFSFFLKSETEICNSDVIFNELHLDMHDGVQLYGPVSHHHAAISSARRNV